jgi:3-hydroxy-5-methyl-1-naphthoate 3-O-methyltransferase
MEFAELAGLAGGHAEARAIQVALRLGLFEVLGRGPHDEAGLAAALKSDRRATALLANALVALGLLVKNAGLYDLAAASRRYLLEESAEFLGGMILFDEALFGTWERLEETIRSGAPARTPDMFQSSAGDTERFIRAMDSLARARGDARWLADNLDLEGVESIADVGGGPGTYMAALVRRWPRLRAAIYDLPATLEVARRVLGEREPEALGRIDLVTVDYLADELPGGRGAIFLSNVIHSEDETTNAKLVRKCFRALRPGGLIIIKDHIMNHELTQPRAGAIFSLYLLLTTRGRDYSYEEVAGWLGQAGFGYMGIHALPDPPFSSSLVTARKPR